MKSNQEDIELLEAYLKGKLDAASVQLLKDRLASEPVLSEDFQDMKILAQGMRAQVLKGKMEMLKDFEKQAGRDSNNTPDNGTHGGWWKWLLLMVGISLVAYLGYRYLSGNEKKIPAEYAVIYADRFDDELILHTTMRATVQSDSLTTEQRRAYEMYSLQLFDEAIPLLDGLWTNQKDTLALFYLGVSYIGSGNVGKGLQTMQKPELKKYSEQTNIFINH